PEGEPGAPSALVEDWNNVSSVILEVIHALGKQQGVGGLIVLRPGKGFGHRHADLLLYLRDQVTPGIADLGIEGMVCTTRIDCQIADPTVQDPLAELRPRTRM